MNSLKIWPINNAGELLQAHPDLKRDKKRRSLIRLGIPVDQAYAWSRTSLGGWRVACSPILGTTLLSFDLNSVVI